MRRLRVGGVPGTGPRSWWWSGSACWTRPVRGELVEDEEFFIRTPIVPAGVYISVTASPVRDESREVVGGIPVLRDVTVVRSGRVAADVAHVEDAGRTFRCRI